MFGFRIVKRVRPRPDAFAAATALLILAVGLVFGLLLEMQGKSALSAFLVLIQGAAGSAHAVKSTLLKAVPIYLCALGVGIAFRMKIWNIGAEGQFALGTIGASGMALAFPEAPAFVLLPCMLMAAMLSGALWAAVPAFLRVRFQANEIITSLMLNYVAVLFLDWLVFGPWKDPVGFGFPMTSLFSPSALVGLIPGTDLHWGLAYCLVAGVLLWLFLEHTILGYEVAVCGESPSAARYAGLPYGFLVMFVMGLSGALAAVAGFLEASAISGRLQPGIMAGYGYTAIVVACLAGLHPARIAPAALFIAGLRVGVENLQLDMQVPAAFGTALEGALLPCVLVGGFFSRYSISSKSAHAATKDAEA
jgi:simple sugar transport system permease protein